MMKNKLDDTTDFKDFVPLTLSFSPVGELYLYSNPEKNELLSPTQAKKITDFFSSDKSVALLRLGLTQFGEPLPPSFEFWQRFSKIFITELCKSTDRNDPSFIQTLKFPHEEMLEFIAQAPFIRGIEYFNKEKAELLWQGLIIALENEIKAFDGNLSNYLSVYHTAWNSIGRVCFHLAENKNNPDFPFAFLATYTTSLSKTAKAQHLPLGKALEEYADSNKKSSLLSLLLPMQRAAEKSSFLKELIETKKIFKPLAWRAADAYQFLKDVSWFEESGVIVRVPNWWNKTTPPRPKINVKIGEKMASTVGLDALLDFNWNISLPSGESLTEEEFKNLLNSTEKLIQVKGQWIEIDQLKLNQVLDHWKTIERKIEKEGLSFAEGLRIISGVLGSNSQEILPEEISSWSTVIEGDWLKSTLSRLRDPHGQNESTTQLILQKSLNAQLRAYQEKGVAWLWWLYNLRLGGCLADDMGLGKTIQMIALMLLIKYSHKPHQPHLLILPTSLLGNWQAEIQRFAPDLKVFIAHTSVTEQVKLSDLTTSDLVITTYGTLHRISCLTETAWDLVILDEAQAIKNPASKRTRVIKLLQSKVRFALTGTPIENRLLDLWSLFDFVAPGLLGSSRVFADFGKKTLKTNRDNGKGEFFAAVRRLVSPYILRRLKSDKKIIHDLPDKIEIQTYCTLTKQQAGLYQQAVNDLANKLEVAEGVQRRGLVLSYLMRFKQICNHPDQWLGHGQYDELISGKFLRLKELCEVIAEKQEKVLIFTQFREIIPAITAFLSQVFRQDGLTLDGQTSVKERAKRVEQFQKPEGPPFFVLSLKAGGTGLNLTAASHVIHFDRWWNPAVENQATDRAFRIGQKRNVLVHKFICRGTIEERIDNLLNSKKILSEEIMGQDNEIVLTELSDNELMSIVTLDIHRALGEK